MALDAELLLAAHGLGNWLTPGKTRYTQATRARALKIPGRIADAWRDFFTKGPQGDPDLAKVDWPTVRKYLDVPMDMAHALDQILGLDDTEIAEQVEAVAVCVGYLKTIAPIRSAPTPLGPEDADPATSELLAFRSVYGVVNDPVSLMDELLAGSLTRNQATAVENCYPDLWSLIKLGGFNALAAIRARREDYELGHRRVRMMEILLRKPSDSPSSIPEQLQEVDDGKEQPNERQGLFEGPDVRTQSQKLEQR